VVIGVARGRIFHHRNLISKLGRVANGCLHTSVCNEALSR
jgi:hypothetical protein